MLYYLTPYGCVQVPQTTMVILWEGEKKSEKMRFFKVIGYMIREGGREEGREREREREMNNLQQKPVGSDRVEK